MNVASVASLYVLLTASLAYAEPGDASVLADSLFREGRRQMESGQLAEGCRKLEESQRIEPASGTLLALATCHEREGKLANAYSEFADSLAAARRESRPERESFAREHLAALEPQLPRLRIEVPTPAAMPGLEILRNGTLVAEPAWGIALPCNPGKVLVSARAPGHKAWSQEVEALAGQVVTLSIPILELEKQAQVVPAASPARAEPEPAPLSPVVASSAPTPRRKLAVWIGAASLVPLVAGGVFGVLAIDRQHASDRNCPIMADIRYCSDSGAAANQRARTYAHLADAGIGLGLVGALTAAILYWTGPTARPHASLSRGGLRVQLAPTLAAGRSGITLVANY